MLLLLPFIVLMAVYFTGSSMRLAANPDDKLIGTTGITTYPVREVAGMIFVFVREDGFPDADVPVAQLSIQPHLDAAHHFRIGRALRDLRDDGVMIVGSGQITHNLRMADFSARPEDADPRVAEFTDWFESRMAERDIDALLD